jgi:hypothetical protein
MFFAFCKYFFVPLFYQNLLRGRDFFMPHFVLSNPLFTIRHCVVFNDWIKMALEESLPTLSKLLHERFKLANL